MAKVLMAASEAAPFVKTGGLADVLGALPAALAAGGDQVAVVLPQYRAVPPDGMRRVWNHLPIWIAGQMHGAAIDMVEREGVSYYFVNAPYFFDRDGIYSDRGADYPDNHLRFAVLSMAALGVARNIFRPDVLHCHDWQTALAPLYLRTLLRGDPRLHGVRTLLTIHNLGYQGQFARQALGELGLDSTLFTPEGIEFYGGVNLLKGGIVASDALNTVSPTYAREIQTPEYGFGLDGLLRSRAGVLSGILNGVDYSIWDPAIDPHLDANYNTADLSGKQACKRRLLAAFGLPAEAIAKPLIGIVSRFAAQKGFDLLQEIAAELADEDCSLVALGSGEPRFEAMFRSMSAAMPEKFGAYIGYNDALAHKIEAGADIFLMPSQYEPCGLNQIYSLRYGTPPCVRATGGLDDTIEEATGFKFSEYSGLALLECLRRALEAFEDRKSWRQRMLAGMRQDFSWKRSAASYSLLYKQLE